MLALRPRLHVVAIARGQPLKPRGSPSLFSPSSAPSRAADAGHRTCAGEIRSRPAAGFATAAADHSNTRPAAARTAGWTVAIISSVAGAYAIDHYSLIDDATTAKKPTTDVVEPGQSRNGGVGAGLTDVQALAIGYGALCTGMVVGWRFWRSLRPVGSYLADVRASPHGFLHWRGGAPRMFSVDNALGRTVLGMVSGGFLLLGAAMVDERADACDGQK